MNPENAQPQSTIKKSNIKPVIFSLLTLLSGIIIGAAGVLMIVRPIEKPSLPEEFSRKMLANLTKELHLTPEQKKQISPIVEKHMAAMDEIRSEARPKIRQELEAMNDELMAVLDNTQKQIWKERIQRMQENFARHRQRHSPGQGPGDRRPDDRRPIPNGQEPPRFRNRVPGPIPPLPPVEPHHPDSPPPPQPQEPIVPPEQGSI